MSTPARPAPRNWAENDLVSLRDILVSPNVNEVAINTDGSVWVEYTRAEHMVRLDVVFPGDRIRALGTHLAGETKNTLGPKRPVVSGMITAFEQPMRVQIVVPPAVDGGMSLSVRKYGSRILNMEEIGFLEGRQVNVEKTRYEKLACLSAHAQAGNLKDALQMAIDERLNILVSGGTSSGKTTVARALLSLTDGRERLVTIEDARELNLPHPNCIAMIAERSNASERSVPRLLESALRMRPDRLILGEIRGEEALSFLEAINTGHPGSISTIHADSPALALERIAMMVMRTGIRMNRRDVLDYAVQTIDMIVQVARRGGRRGVLEINTPGCQAG